MKKYITGIFLAYTALFLAVVYLKYARFLYFDFDLTIATLILRNLSRGELVSHFYGMATLLSSGHMSLVNFFLLPFYLVFPSALTLLFMQTLFLGSGVFAVYLISKEVLGKEWPVLPAVIYAFYPALQYINLYEVHYIAFSIPLLLFTFYFYLKKRFVPFVIFMVFSLFCREEVALVLAGLGVYIWLRSLINKEGFPLKWLAAVFSVLALFTLAFFLSFANPRFIATAMPGPEKLGSAYFNAFYSWLADAHTPNSIISHLFSSHNLKYIMELFLPLAFICLFDISFVVVIFGLTHILLSDWPLHANIYFQHSSIAIPFLFISFIFGLKRVISRTAEKKSKKSVLSAVSVVCLASAVYIGPLPRIISGIETKPQKDSVAYVRMREYLLKQVPADEPLVSTFAFSSHLADRNALTPFYVFTYDKALEYIPQVRRDYKAAVIDFDDPLTFHSLFYTARDGLLSRCFFSGSGWGLAATIDNLALYRQGIASDFKLVESLGVRHDLTGNSVEALKVLRSDFRPAVIDKFPVLETSFDVLKNSSEGDFIPALRITNARGEEFYFEYLASYRLYPFREWKKGEAVRIKARVFIPREFRGDDARSDLIFNRVYDAKRP